MPRRRRKLRQTPTQAPLPFEECQLVSAAEPVGSGLDPSSAPISANQDKETFDPASRTLMPSSSQSLQDAASSPKVTLSQLLNLMPLLSDVHDTWLDDRDRTSEP